MTESKPAAAEAPGTTRGPAIENDLLQSYVERLERVDAELADCRVDRREILKAAKGHGFDTKILNQVVRERRRDPIDRSTAQMTFDTYWDAAHAPRKKARAA